MFPVSPNVLYARIIQVFVADPYPGMELRDLGASQFRSTGGGWNICAIP